MKVTQCAICKKPVHREDDFITRTIAGRDGEPDTQITVHTACLKMRNGNKEG